MRRMSPTQNNTKGKGNELHERRKGVQLGLPPHSMLNSLLPFLALLIVALIFNVIPMEETLKRVGYIVIGVVAVILLLKFLPL